MKFTLLSYLLLIIASCSAQTDSVHHLNAESFEKSIQNKNIQILDVRTEGEFKSGHIKNALLINWNDKSQFQDRVQYISKDEPVYIYCLSGARSAAAASWMREKGYKKVVELEGGINAWKKAGLPVEGIREEKQMSFEEYRAAIPDNETVLVDIGAPWCPPCKTMEPVIKELQHNPALHFKLLKIDADTQTEILKKLEIDPIPVFIIYKAGKEIWRREGVISKEELSAQLK